MVFSSAATDRLPSGHLRAIVDRWAAGKLGLCLLADNSPYTSESAAIMSAILPGTAIAGNYRGEQSLRPRTDGGPGFVRESELFHNINTLWEGITISRITGPAPLEPLCYASDGGVLIASLQRGKSSRLVVHCGFTSFYERFWQDAGVKQLAVNIAGWLSRAEVERLRISARN